MRVAKPLQVFVLCAISLEQFARPCVPQTGFTIYTEEALVMVPGGQPVITTTLAFQEVDGFWQQDIPPGPTMQPPYVTGFSGVTDVSGFYTINVARIPAYWQFSFVGGPCSGLVASDKNGNTNVAVYPMNTLTLACESTSTVEVAQVIVSPNPFGRATSPIYINGNDGVFPSANGPYKTEVCDSQGHVYSTTSATWESSSELKDIRVNVPSAGAYWMMVEARQADGSYKYSAASQFSYQP